MKIEDAIRGVLTRPGWTTTPSVLTLDDLRAADWAYVPQTVPVPTPTPTPTPTPAPAAESPQGTTLSGATGSITDAKGVVWTLSGGKFFQNGTLMAGTGNITLAVYWNHQVYQQAAGYGWFVWNGTVWSSTTDPRAAAPVPTPTPTPTPTPSPTPAPAAGRMVGANIAGGEFNTGGTRVNTDYVYPTNAQLDYWAAKGFNSIRLPFLSKRFAGDAAVIDGLINYAATKGLTVILDLHEYGQMTTTAGLIGVDAAATSAFVAFWQTLAARYKGKTNVVFGLMNEPNQQTPSVWFAAAKLAIAGIAGIDPVRVVTVPGSAWTGAHAWISSGNGAAALAAGFPAGTIFEMHQYLDSDSSGTHATVVAGKGATCLVAATDWLRANNMKGWLGEFGFAQDAASIAEGQAMIAYAKANADVWLGGAYWAAGAWWGGYMFSIEPSGGSDKPQLAVLNGLR